MDKVKEILPKIVAILFMVGFPLALVGVFMLTDEYEPTAFDWCVILIALACLVIGLLAAVCLLVIKLKEEHGAKTVLIASIVLLVVVVAVIFFANLPSSNANSSHNDYPYGYEKCFRCDGSGLVNEGFIDFKTCPTCGGSGMLDSH